MKTWTKIVSCLVILSVLLAPAALADLKRGDQSAEVEQLQRLLFECGWLFEIPDGQFGRNTEQAVKDYEAYAGLPADGVADDVMIDSLTNDWYRMFAESDADADGANANLTPYFCHHWTQADGNSHIDYCETHMAMYDQAAQLMSTGDPDDAKQACALWQSEIDRLYDQWIERSDESVRASIAAGQALFMSAAEAHCAAIDGWYATFQSPLSAAETQYALELHLREHAAWLCAMLSGSLVQYGVEG